MSDRGCHHNSYALMSFQMIVIIYKTCKYQCLTSLMSEVWMRYDNYCMAIDKIFSYNLNVGLFVKESPCNILQQVIIQTILWCIFVHKKAIQGKKIRTEFSFFGLHWLFQWKECWSLQTTTCCTSVAWNPGKAGPCSYQESPQLSTWEESERRNQYKAWHKRGNYINWLTQWLKHSANSPSYMTQLTDVQMTHTTCR